MAFLFAALVFLAAAALWAWDALGQPTKARHWGRLLRKLRSR